MTTVQYAYQPAVKALWDDLFTPDGCEIYLKDARWYVALGTPVSFRQLYGLARQRNEMLVGYLLAERPGSPQGGTKLFINPSNKNEQNIVLQKGDVLVVIADDLH
jgi:hypothetical protein